MSKSRKITVSGESEPTRRVAVGVRRSAVSGQRSANRKSKVNHPKGATKCNRKLTSSPIRRKRRETSDERELRLAMKAVGEISLSQKAAMFSGPKRIAARYDSAQITDDNRKHWANADNLSANAAALSGVRQILRNRARYEVANNSYARGIVQTLANDTIGMGPRLQMLTDDEGVNQIVEYEFAAWAQSIGMAEKLRTMRVARAQDGEAFGILTTNPALPSPVKLDIRLIEADQVADPGDYLSQQTDGIVFDEFGNPLEYHVLRSHPGSMQFGAEAGFSAIPAKNMIHWFRADRPGQSRGLPDIMPALPLFAQLRRYTLATLDAAEAAADFATVLYTDAPAGGEADDSFTSMDVIELERRMMTTLPSGWKLGQITPQQPTTTYQMFKQEILNEIARCLNMPYNIAACNSGGYNMASGYLDQLIYFKSIRIDQAHCGIVVADHILDAWMAEAVKVLAGLFGLDEWPHQWFWECREHPDPAKESRARDMNLLNHSTTLAAEYARQGKDWETEIRQRAKEVALVKELGLTQEQAKPSSGAPEIDRTSIEETQNANA